VIGDNQLAVTPAQNLTDNQRDFLKQYKAEIISELQAERLPKLVKCGNCASWQPLHQHRKGGGFCASGIYPLALVHWSETLKNCDKWRRESER
jgi:hypothetical protein